MILQIERFEAFEMSPKRALIRSESGGENFTIAEKTKRLAPENTSGNTIIMLLGLISIFFFSVFYVLVIRSIIYIILN